jgi:hypothetical protein
LSGPPDFSEVACRFKVPDVEMIRMTRGTRELGIDWKHEEAFDICLLLGRQDTSSTDILIK